MKHVSEIGFRYAEKLRQELIHPLALGSVLKFDFGRGSEQKLYMVVCHKIGMGGWKKADMFLRYGLDSIYMNTVGKYAIVDVGTGLVGVQDGADTALLRKAMADTFLPLDLYVRANELQSLTNTAPLELVARAAWHPHGGTQNFAMAA